MGVCRDISERKASEEALREAHEQLDARVKERTSELDHAQEQLAHAFGAAAADAG